MICSVPSFLLLLTKRARTRLAWGKSTGQLTRAETIDAPLSSTSSSFQRKFVNKTKRESASERVSERARTQRLLQLEVSRMSSKCDRDSCMCVRAVILRERRHWAQLHYSNRSVRAKARQLLLLLLLCSLSLLGSFVGCSRWLVSSASACATVAAEGDDRQAQNHSWAYAASLPLSLGFCKCAWVCDWVSLTCVCVYA